MSTFHSIVKQSNRRNLVNILTQIKRFQIQSKSYHMLANDSSDKLLDHFFHDGIFIRIIK